MSVVLAYFVLKANGLAWDFQGPTVWKGASAYYVLKYGVAFFLGGVFFVFGDRVPLSCGFAVACLLMIFATSGTSGAEVAYIFGVAYLVLYSALSAPWAGKTVLRFGDISYGFYIYAFPIQQLVIYCFRDISPSQLTFISSLLTFLFAFMSWRYVESPVLVRVRGVRGRGSRNVSKDALSDVSMERAK